jgi:hypothetical protein
MRYSKTQRQRIEMNLRFQKREEYLDLLGKYKGIGGSENYIRFLQTKIRRIEEYLGINN